MKACLFVLFMSFITCCKTTYYPVNKQYGDIVTLVINYLESNGYRYLYNHKEQCYLINPKIFVNKHSCSYAFWNLLYYHTYVTDNKKQVFVIKDSLASVNYHKLKKLKDRTFYIPQSNNYQECIKFLSEKEIEEIKGKEIYPEGTYTFSPLIPKNNKGDFELWLSISDDRSSPEFRFSVKSVKGSFQIVSHQFDDFCNSPSVEILEDQIK